MVKRFVLAAVTAAIMTSPVFAADAPKMTKAQMEAQWMCRPAMSGEKPTAMMGDKGIVCKNVPAMSPKMGPAMKAGMTAEQMDAAWRAWLEQQMLINAAGGGASGGNG